jgi:hypothetical protein
VVPDNVHDFFLGSAGVAGALIGLLFVAISVSAGRLSGDGAPVHRIRAAAALSAFLNTLVLSLFALVPGHKIGPTAVSAGASGIAFVAASLLSLVRLRQVRWSTARDALFLVGQAVIFAIQIVEGVDVIGRPGDAGAVDTIAILVIVCFLFAISRSWELIGGPSFGITHEVVALVRGREPEQPQAGETQPGETGPGPAEAEPGEARS